MSSPASLLHRVAPALAVALVVAALGTIDDVAAQAPGFADLSLLFTPAGVTVLYISLLGGACLLAGEALGRFVWEPFRAIAFGGLLWLGLYTYFFAPFGAYPVPLPTESGPTAPLAAVTALAAALGGLAWRRWQSERIERGLVAVGAGAAAALAAGCGIVWYLAFPLDQAPSGGLIATVLAAAGGAAGWFAFRRRPTAAARTLAALALATAAGAIPATGVPAPRPPAPAGANAQTGTVILLTIDTLRADAVGGPESQTPHIDALAADSVVFERAISGGPWTAPGLTAIATGLAPDVHRRMRAVAPPLPDSVPTLGTLFDEQGWTTAAVGDNPFLQLFGMDRGFQWRHTHPHRSLGRSFGFRALEQISPRFVWDPGTDDLVGWALSWLRENPAEPRFLWLHLYDPHDPYAPPRRYIRPEEADPRIGLEFWDFGGRHPHDIDPRMREWVRRLYDGEVRWVDDQVGRFVDGLRELGLYDEALIAVASDHGEEFFEHGQWNHGQSLYNELLHVPLMLKPPGSATTQRVAGYVSTVALAPTLLDMAGVDYDPSRFSEASLRAYLEGEPPQPSPAFSTGTTGRENLESVVLAGRKYIRWPLSGIEETYDLEKNPRELPRGFDEELAAKARELLGEHAKQSAKLRELYGIEADRDARRDQGTIDRLKGLGYIQ